MSKRRIQSKKGSFRHTITFPEILSILVCILFIGLSVTIVNDHLSSPQFHSETIRILDEQKNDALSLSVAVTAASTALSILPNDTASPIAAELADLSLPLFLIVAITYLEIFLLTTFGWITSTFLLPAVCLLRIGFILCRKEYILVWIKKIIVLSLALIMLIPASAAITSHIEDTFAETVDQKLHAASHIANIAETEEEEDANAILSFFSELADNVVSTVDAARNMLSTLVDAVAILMITSCIIPVLTLLLFLQAIKIAMNADIPTRYLALLVPPTKRDHQKLEEAKEIEE
ncbi:MAG: hypothetical protein IJ418_11350 [Clostridia bacterium]|nr:hypothetical protein [Clostridia bacterium]